MRTTWVVAADSSRARIFELSSANKDFHEIEDLVNPPGRSANRELDSDAYGRYYGKGERNQAHTAPPRVDAVEHETEMFSKELGEYLDQARTQHRYECLRLIAPAKFLGLIRKNLSKEAQELVDVELVKDISWFDSQEIADYIIGQKH